MYRLGFLAALATLVLTGAPPALAQSRSIYIGLDAEYLFLVGNWRSSLEDGPGLAGFIAYQGTSAVARVGAAVSFHHEDFLIPELPGALLGANGETHTMQRFFGELRYAPPGRPLVLIESIGARLARLHAPSLYSAWQYEATATTPLALGPHTEIVAAAGVVRFPEEPYPRPRTANTFRIGVSFAMPVSR